jgi:hypothetical protein
VNPTATDLKALRFTPRRKRLIDALVLAVHTMGGTGFQTTDGVPTHLILNGRAVSEATSADFRAMLAAGLLLTDGKRLTVTMWGQRHHIRWEGQRYVSDPRVAGVNLW